MTTSLSEAAKQAKREYQKQWREKNKNKLKNYQSNWRANNKDKIKQYQKDYWERKSNEENAGQ